MKDDATKLQQLNQTAPSLADENRQLRQEIDILTNKLAFFVELVQQLRDEIAVLKGQRPRPKFPPSKLESKQNSGDNTDSSDPNSPSPPKKQKPGQPKGKKRKKKKTILEIHNEVVLQPANIHQPKIP